MTLVDAMIMALHSMTFAQEDKKNGKDPMPMIGAAERYLDLATDLDTGHEMTRSIGIIRNKLEMMLHG